MTNSQRPDPIFIADQRALDVLNSVAAPWGEQIEWLGSGADLLAWLEQAGLIPPAAAAQFRKNTSHQTLDEIAARARDLREWFRNFVAAHAGRRLAPGALAELDRLNRLIAGDAVYGQIEPRVKQAHDADRPILGSDELPLQWRRHRRWQKPEDLLLPIAEAMGDLICETNFARVKNCESQKCPLWFHDISKNHTRRWCMMSVCGNRAKAAAHRAKMRASRQE